MQYNWETYPNPNSAFYRKRFEMFWASKIFDLLTNVKRNLLSILFYNQIAERFYIPAT